MKPNVLRAIGILFAVAAIVVAVANLRRVANLQMPWLAPLLIVTSAVCMISARRRKEKSV
jgi:hypothetical protein